MKSWLKVPIHNGSMLIDLDSWGLYTSKKWHVSDTGYAVSRGGTPKKTTRFHRVVNITPSGLTTDHINHERLDNRSENLRSVTQSGNLRNLTDQGKGYWYSRQSGNWVVVIYGIHRGTFAEESEAAEFAKRVRGGEIDKKPSEPKTVCRHGHSLVDAYFYNGAHRCKICQKLRSQQWFKRSYIPVGQRK